MKLCETVQFTVHCSADFCIESLFSLVVISKTSPSPETPYEYFHVGTHGTIIKELLLTTRKLMALKSRKKKSLYFFLIFLSKEESWVFIIFKNHSIELIISVKERLSSYHFQQAQEVLQKSMANCYYQFYLLLKPAPLVPQWTIIKNINWKISAFKLLNEQFWEVFQLERFHKNEFPRIVEHVLTSMKLFSDIFLSIWGYLFISDLSFRDHITNKTDVMFSVQFPNGKLKNRSLWLLLDRSQKLVLS